MDARIIDPHQSLQDIIKLFSCPCLIVDGQGQVVVCNQALLDRPNVCASLDELTRQLTPLLQGRAESINWTVNGQPMILTALPLAGERFLVTCVPAQLSSFQHRYNNILTAIEQMTDALIICNAENCIELVNASLRNCFANMVDNIEGKHVMDFVGQVIPHTDASGPVIAERLLRRFIQKKITLGLACNLKFRLADGRYIEYRDTLTQSGERIGLFIDETDFLALNEQLENACDQALYLSQAKSTFIAAMSHEIRTPLGAIIGLLDLCFQEKSLAQNEFLQRIQHNARHLMCLLNDVLDYTKFEAKKVELTPVPTNIRYLCESLLEDFLGQALSGNTSLSLFVDPNIPDMVEIDDVRLRQILSNLVSNALKFNRSQQPTVSLAVLLQSAPLQLKFSVCDNGIGIDKQQQDVIFSGFMQASHETHREYGGTGLGLSICKNICALMQGELLVESELGEGSCFYFVLPLAQQNNPELSQIDTDKAASLSLTTNDELFYAALRQYQQFIGYHCHFGQRLPASLADNEYLFINPDNYAGKCDFTDLDQARVAFLLDATQAENDGLLHQLQRSPLKLFKLLSFVGLADDKPDQAAETTSHKVKSAEVKSLRTLFVEDNKDNMYILHKQCEALGIKASFAMSPEDALIYFEQQQFDVVISDYQMPNLSGAQLIRSLRKTEQQEDRLAATMLVITADKTQSCYDDCMAAGADKVMLKPLTLSILSILLTEQQVQRNRFKEEEHSSAPQAEAVAKQSKAATPVVADEQVASRAGKIFDIQALYEFIGNVSEQDKNEFLVQYAQNLAENKVTMLSAIIGKKWDELRKLAHNLKSNALILGAEKLSEDSRKLERLCEKKEYAGQIEFVWWRTQMSIEKVLKCLAEELSKPHE